MNLDATLLDRIDDYLSGKLPPEEAAALEQQAASDPEIAEAIEFVRLEREGMELVLEENLRERMGMWQSELPASVPIQPFAKSVFSRYSGRAALLLAVLLVGAWWFLQEKPEQVAVPPAAAPKPEDTLSEKTVAPVAQEGGRNEQTAFGKDTQPSAPQGSNRQLVAMAESRLTDFRGAVLQQYGATQGNEEDESLLFKEGLAAFKANDGAKAKSALTQIPASDATCFGPAQEMLAVLFFQEKNYPAAIRAYESFATTSADEATRWHLLHLYLTDYARYRAPFWALQKKISQPGSDPRFQQQAVDLRRQLLDIGLTEQ